jgi:arylformamidase
MKFNIDSPIGMVSIDLKKPISIAIPIAPNKTGPNCFFADPFTATFVREGDYVADVSKGSPVNSLDWKINPHGNGTHTECIGHITDQGHTVDQALQHFHYWATLISISPKNMENGDNIITADQLKSIPESQLTEAIIIRTLPNSLDKNTRQYSGNNPPYFEADGLSHLRKMGCIHLLTDLPSVDREQDDGKILGHKAFWNYDKEWRTNATITELIFIPESVEDGLYLLQFSLPRIASDAVPSQPILYRAGK